MLSGVIVSYQIPPGDEMKCLFTSVFSRKKFDDILIVFRIVDRKCDIVLHYVIICCFYYAWRH